MATISARRRPIRDGAERSNECKCRISQLPSAPAEIIVSRSRAQAANMVPLRTRVESSAKIATRPSSQRRFTVDLLPPSGRRRPKSSLSIIRAPESRASSPPVSPSLDRRIRGLPLPSREPRHLSERSAAKHRAAADQGKHPDRRCAIISMTAVIPSPLEASSGRTLQPGMSTRLENMFLTPRLQRSEHGAKLHSFGGDHIFRSWRMIGIETPFDDPVVFKRLQTRRKRIRADAGQ
jgi:hypothetical protein